MLINWDIDHTETPSSSFAAQLRQAAKQTMRRKQALAARQALPTIPNAAEASSSNQSSSMALSGGPSSAKLPPKGPHSTNPLQTYWDHGLIDTGKENAAIEINNNDDMNGRSPKTAQMNQQISAQLLEMGIDEYHCRPNLPMTFQQFDDAKRLILDLLGLGMTPEDIADVGINRHLLVYCLRELKIRPAVNVATDDIISFGPLPDIVPDGPKEDSQVVSATQLPQNARSNFKLTSPEPPERSVTTYQEGVELLPSTTWNQPQDHLEVDRARHSEVSQFPAAAVALSPPGSAKEPEPSRLQEEEGSAQLRPEVHKLIKQLQLETAEKKLHTFRSTGDESAVLRVRKEVETLKQELEAIQAKLQPLPPQNDKPRSSATPINSDGDFPAQSSGNRRNNSLGLGIPLRIRAPKRKRKRNNQPTPRKEGNSGSGSGSGEWTYSESRANSLSGVGSDRNESLSDFQPSSPVHERLSSRSRSELGYHSTGDQPQTSSLHEYALHSCLTSVRQRVDAAPYPAPTLGISDLLPPSHGDVARHVPSHFPQFSLHYPLANRPKCGNSSEGDESKGGLGKYECEYCSKRFDRPRSLLIHTSTHVEAKPFQCSLPSCGRRFFAMSNMRRHARTHGNMLSLATGEGAHSYPQSNGGGEQGPTSAPVNTHHLGKSSFVDPTGKSAQTDADVEMGELGDEDYIDYDGEVESDGD